MPNPKLLGQLASIHELQAGLLEATPSNDCNTVFHPELATLSWYLGYSVYLETYWLDEIIANEDDLSKRVRHFFATGKMGDNHTELPPKEHLLNWAMEIYDKHLTQLANPSQAEQHELLQDDRLLSFIVQEQAKNYENMLLVLNQKQCQTNHNYEPHQILQATSFDNPIKQCKIGHYKIGGKDNILSYDNELPIQMVELHSFLVSQLPVNNAQYLQFMQNGGYQNTEYWSEPGQQWLANNTQPHPEYWCQSEQGNWYAIASNGAIDLLATDAVNGLCFYEAEAWCNWLSKTSTEHKGAALQHEYQFETALRNQLLMETGRAMEWCNNDFHPYDQFVPFPDNMDRNQQFKPTRKVMRGATFHSQHILRRPSIRHPAKANEKYHLTGIRPVFPASR